MNEVDDWELVARAQAGDMDAFAELVRRYQGPVVHFCQRMTGSLEDAEDVAQECFVRLHRYLKRLEPQAKFSTVLFGMARNLTLNHLRDTKRRGRGMTDTIENRVIAADARLEPDRQARIGEIESLLQRALGMLTPEHREVLLLRELQGMDYDAIAAAVKCRKGTVKSRIARAREQLRLKLVELGGDVL